MAVLRRLLFLLFLPVAAYGQGLRYDNFVVKPLPAGGLQAVSGALVTVCTSAGAGTPCVPKVANIYSDQALTVPIVGTGGAGTTNSDASGNFGFYISPGDYVITITGSGITSYTIKTTLPCPVSGACAFVGNDSACQLNGVLYVGISGSTCWAGADIGAQLNSAYASCPAATSVCHIVNVNSTPASFTTPIVFTTKGKYFLLESLFPCVVTISASFGGCLNYTPVTATSAITIDVYDPAVTNEPIHTGMRNVGLLNNNCTTSGGCGSLAVGIQIGNTNGGLMDGLMDNIAVYGFNIGYQNSNVAATDVHWSNSFFQSNAVAEKIGTVQDWNLNGKWIGNGNALLAVPTKTPELHWTNPDLVGNSSLPVLDFTSAGSAGNPAHFFSVNGHYENGQNTAADLQYIAGNVDMYFAGGTMGNDSSSGTGSWYISCSGTQLNIEAVEFQSGRPVTQAILLNSPCRAGGQVGNFSPANITTFFGGANAANNTVLVTTGNTANAQSNWNIEAPVTLAGLSSFKGNTVALTADWTCGTAGTVSSCVAATIIGSGGGVPLTFTLPLAAQSYTLECDGVVGQATAATANQWNLLTATNGATNVTANYSMATAATASAFGAVTDQASTTTTFQIAPSWTLGGTATKMPFHIYAKIEGASASGTVVSLQLVAPTVGDVVTIYRGAACRLF